MKFEEEIFARKKINTSKLIKYGFKRIGNIYVFEKLISNNNFKVVITVNDVLEIKGKIIDLNFGDEYTNYKVEEQVGAFVGNIRKQYIDILNSIAISCTENQFFKFDQSNRIASLIKEKYGDTPLFPWEDENGVFKNMNSEKWYAIIMKINKSKIDVSSDKEVEVINVKLDKDEINELVGKNGYYKAYHMNKTYWITICLDDTLEDVEIMDKIEKSHKYTETVNEWILPANTKYFDIIRYMDRIRPLLWKQPNSKVNVGDFIYVYIGQPYSALMYKCRVVKNNLEPTYEYSKTKEMKEMELEVIKKYDKNKFTFKKLNELGIKAVRGPRTITEKLKNEIDKEG